MNLPVPKIYQLRIALSDTEPEIWRRVHVPSDLFMHDLHKVIQTLMGWENCHMHHFLRYNCVFGIADEVQSRSKKRFIDYTSVRLVDLLKEEGDSMQYVYDFGDYWLHEISLESVLFPDPELYYPICIAGEMNGPPEDCGGVGGYREILAIYNTPGHSDRDMLLQWLSEGWRPDEFDMDMVNEMLMEDDFGCAPVYD